MDMTHAVERVGAGAVANPADLLDRFLAAWSAGDARVIADLHAPGAVVTLADGRCAVGRRAIAAAYEAALALGLDVASVAQRCEALIAGSQAVTSHRDAAGRLHTQIAVLVPGEGWRWAADRTRLAALPHPDLVGVTTGVASGAAGADADAHALAS